MDRHKLLLSGAVAALGIGLAALVVTPAVAAVGSSTCSTYEAQVTGCSGAQASGNTVDVWANQSTVGAGGGGATWGGQDAVQGTGQAGAGGSSAPSWSFYPRVPDSPQQARGYCYVLVNRAASCFQVPTPATPAMAPVAEAAYIAPTITMADVASFSPIQPTLATEPLGWAVVGLESNMIAGTSTHVAAGRLLGAAAEVRFTPVSFDFRYGDGASRSSTSSGAPWATQGLPEFSPTATSHVYSQTGSYPASVRVSFSLEYRWGAGPWTAIEGRVYGTAPAQVVLVVNATNVLMQEACQQGIAAPGC
ncbi:MAG: hypothetical protein JJE28_08385 [Actinomycetales bacterium]|nr:hypothetical protein [Actinomycetales bacterium]